MAKKPKTKIKIPPKKPTKPVARRTRKPPEIKVPSFNPSTHPVSTCPECGHKFFVEKFEGNKCALCIISEGGPFKSGKKPAKRSKKNFSVTVSKKPAKR